LLLLLLLVVCTGLYAFLSLMYAALANVATVAVLAVHDTKPSDKPHVLLLGLVRVLDGLCHLCPTKRTRSVHVTQQATCIKDNDVIDKSIAELNSTSDVSSETDWTKQAALLDTFFFWFFLVANLVTIIVFFAVINNVNRSDIDGDWLAHDSV
jgi:hypothetical protein